MKSLLIIASLLGGTAQAATFNSPNAVTEACTALPQIPGGSYAKGDLKEEAELCAVDFYNTTGVALCPKTWSTSPATMVYDITKSGLSQRDYEAQPTCGGSKKGHDSIAKFKQSMNQSGTSGTFSPSSLLYYHFSRYFDTSVEIPVAVYRTMDKEAHFDRVTKKAHTGNMGKSEMIRAGWKWMFDSEQNPAVYKPTTDLFTDDLKQIYGVLLDGGGERYGTEINGIRSKWGDPQNEDFQDTPAFRALRSELPLHEAIKSGLADGMRDRAIAQDMGGGASPAQMAVWMRELTEITLLDYIFSQQDRVGNIDFKWYLYYADETGAIKSDRIKVDTARKDMKSIVLPRPGELLQRSQLNDNDAGGRPAYRNYTKRTEMLQKIRHIGVDTYRKLLALDADLQARGAVYGYLSTQFNLSEQQVTAIGTLTSEAAAIYKNTCKAGKLRFDLYSTKQVIAGENQEQPADCDKP